MQCFMFYAVGQEVREPQIVIEGAGVRKGTFGKRGERVTSIHLLLFRPHRGNNVVWYSSVPEGR